MGMPTHSDVRPPNHVARRSRWLYVMRLMQYRRSAPVTRSPKPSSISEGGSKSLSCTGARV